MIEPNETGAEIAVPLVEAAEVLGLTTDALRARLRRGKARGMRRDGRVYVYVPAGAERTHSENVGVRTLSGHSREGATTAEAGTRESAELERLRRDNERLNDRVDDLLKLQEREQVLRQQTQAFLDKIGDRLAAPATETRASPDTMPPDVEHRLERSEADLEVLKTAIAQLVRYLGKRDA